MFGAALIDQQDGTMLLGLLCTSLGRQHGLKSPFCETEAFIVCER